MARASKALVAALALVLGMLALVLVLGAGRSASGAAAPTEPPFVAQRWDDDGTWRFDPAPDRFSPDALLDLRAMNEPVAGAAGFVRSDGQGGFVRGDEQPLRFWAINSDVARRPFDKRPLWQDEAPDLARHARFLAKRGVNLVRMHRQIAPDLGRTPQAAIDDIDERERDAIWRMVAAMKREGIYSAISPYWAVPMKFSEAWGVAGGAQQSALGLLFFDPQLKAAYKTWLRKLLTPPNPYTGVPLARDASVALLQLQNEDSLLFWTAGAIAGPQRAALEARYAAFARRKHGSIAQALAAWGGERDAKDASDDTTLALLDWWRMTQPAAAMKPGLAARIADQTEFLATTMRDFNQEMVDFLRKELQVGSLINAGNWKTASAERLSDAERWSYGPGEVDAVNRYNAGLHIGPNAGWAVVAGDRYASPSALFDPGLLPTNLRQTLGRPMLVTEGGWPMPQAWALEGPLLVSAYSALNGVAGYLWFATDAEGYAPPRSANGYLPSQAMWDVATPELMGQFPAAALIYRRGDVQPASPALVERRPAAELWRRAAPRLAERDGYDPNRDAGVGPQLGVGEAKDRVSPRVFLQGPVRVGFDEGVGKGSAELAASASAALADPQRTRSSTGELLLDHGLGLLRIDTPRAQGVVGSLAKAGPQRLADVEIDSRDAFAAVVLVSLDGLPIREAQRVLVQIATPARPQGWAEQPVAIALPEAQRSVPGRRIDSIGTAPWRVRKSAVTLRLFRAGLNEAVVLDANGEAIASRPIASREVQGRAQIELAVPPDAAWLVLRR